MTDSLHDHAKASAKQTRTGPSKAGGIDADLSAALTRIAALEAKAHTHPVIVPAPPDPTPPPANFPWSSLQQAIAATPVGGTLDATGHTFTEPHVVFQRPILLKAGALDAKNSDYWADVWADDVRIDGTTFLNASNGGYHTGAIRVSKARFSLANAIARNGGYSAVQLWVGAVDAKVLTSEFSGSVLGVIGYNADRALVEGNRLHDCRGSADIGNESGGLKMADSKDVILRGNESHHNEGPGLWLDGNCPGFVIELNDCHDNTNSGIMSEIVPSGTIRNNKAYRNGFAGGKAYERQANIFISSCAHVSVTGNTAAWVKEPSVPDILFVSQTRDDALAYNPKPRTGNSATGNILRAAVKGVDFFSSPADPNVPILVPNTFVADTDPQIASLR